MNKKLLATILFSVVSVSAIAQPKSKDMHIYDKNKISDALNSCDVIIQNNEKTGEATMLSFGISIEEAKFIARDLVRNNNVKFMKGSGMNGSENITYCNIILIN